MRAVVITRHGPPEVLQVQERPDPVPGPGEVLIDVKAAGINFADIMARLGLYPDAPKPPCVIGYEVAGTVARTGSDVDADLQEGLRITAPVRFNGYADRVVVQADSLVPLPEGLGFEEGAAIPVNYSTAWEALIRQANLQPGERVLIHAARGRSGHRRNPDRQARRGGGMGHRLSRQARRHQRAGGRPPDRLPQSRMGAPGSAP